MDSGLFMASRVFSGFVTAIATLNLALVTATYFAQGYLSDRTVIRGYADCWVELCSGLLARTIRTREQSAALRLRRKENRPAGQRQANVTELRLFFRRR